MRATSRLVHVVILLVLGGGLTTTATAEHGGALAVVEVRAGAFLDRATHVAPDGTVTWEVLDGGHSVRADDGRFHFGSRTTDLEVGTSVAWTAGDTDEVVRYFCEVHGGPGGQGMSGVVVVGDPRPAVADVDVLRVPEDAATLAEAVAMLPRGRIELAPGEHRVDEPVVVDTADVAGLTIAGTGERPEDVRLVGDRGPLGQVESVLRITGTHVSVHNLTVTGARRAGVHLDGANQAGLVDVDIEGRGLTDDGLLVTDGPGGGAGVQRLRVDGVRRAAVRIEPCVNCGVTIQAAELRDSLVGVLVTGAVGVEVHGSVIIGNGAGVVVRAAAGRPSSVVVAGTTIEDNTRPGPLPPPGHPDRELATGTGLLLDGVFDSVLRETVVTGHEVGIHVVGGARHRLARLVVDDNGQDLVWDVPGVAVADGAVVGSTRAEATT